MITLADWLPPTRFIGLSAYLFATICCAIAWARGRGTPRLGRLAAVLLVPEAGFFLDMVFSIRWQLHDLLQGEAVRENVYDQRIGPQVAALGLFGVTAAAVMGLAFQRLRGRTAATVAACGAILSLSCWCAEVISLHAVDAVFYSTVDGVMPVSLCWVACCLMTGLGILWDARAARSDTGQGANPAGKRPPSLTNS
jgi:hypothetical protein